MDSQYTKGDKVLAWSVFIYSIGWGFGSFLLIITWNWFSSWPEQWWANWFYIQSILVAGIIGSVTTVWFSIGGTWDLVRMFRRLADKAVNVLDDGRVIGHVSADEVAMVYEAEKINFDDEVILDTDPDKNGKA